jgi:hypothetical protein
MYESWLQDNPDLLWICGGPGKGKTVMSIFLTQVLEHQNRDDIIYYFCNSEDDRNSTSSAILRALIWQIMAKRPGLASLVLPYFQSPERDQGVLSTPGTLFEIFVKLAQDDMMAPMYCLIDGLDECEPDSIRWIASRLAGLYRGTQVIKMHICVVSRDILELRPSRQILLDPDNNDKVDTDVATFTSLKMKDLTRRHNLSEDISLRIQAQLLYKAEGTFLWIGYAVHELLNKATTMQVLEALEEMPAALPALYSRMIRNIPVDNLHICVLILRWVALAVQSLTVDELADAVKWHVPNQMTPDQAAQDYISLCKPLILTQSGKVALVHQSVKDYLLRTQPDDDPLVESVRIKIAESHLAMADRCLKVIGGHSALVTYADEFWPEHAKQCGRLASPWIVKNDQFFKERSEPRKCWWERYTLAPEHKNRLLLVQNGPLDPPQLHMACLIGFKQWVEDILTSKSRFFKPWKRSLHQSGKDLATPLHFAICSPGLEAVEYLLEKGADPNRNFGKLGSPFTYAMRLAHLPEIYPFLERMIACGADVHTMLRRAIHTNDRDLLDVAIIHGANLDWRMEYLRTGKRFASVHLAFLSWMHADVTPIIGRLLEAGANPLVKDKDGETAIQAALHAFGEVRSAPITLRREAEGRLVAIMGIFEDFGYWPA